MELEESVARAVRQVEHVVARGFAGALWYVGNEDGAQGCIDIILCLEVILNGHQPGIPRLLNLV